jgi:hypothetical protein
MAEITFTLPNFPRINQLRDKYQGKLDNNASWDCVPASLSDGLTWLTRHSYHEGELKAAIYGARYQGGQAASAYVGYCEKHGVALAPYNAEPKLHQELEARHPVVATIPSEWGIPRVDQRPGYTTHVVIFCGSGPGALRADNPWIAPEWHDGDDAYWEARLCDFQIWVMSGSGQSTEAGGGVVPQGWHDDGKVLTGPNGQHVVRGFREYILAHDWYPKDVPLAGEVPVTGGSEQRFKYTILTYTPATNVVPHDAVDMLEAQVTSLQTELSAAQTQVTTLQTQSLDLQTQLSASQTQIADLQAQLSAAQSQAPTSAGTPKVLGIFRSHSQHS